MPATQAALETAAERMTAFARRTGLIGGGSERRYLWTDAFALCNFLELARRTGDARYGELARALVARVHAVLGRHHPDDPRDGWLSGLQGREAEAHPTRGGLRIGKPLPERGPDEPYDEALEWERDGQYFHYLTKWMHALDQLAGASGDARYHRWACELAEAAHAAFVRDSPAPGGRRMVWKMSTDLARPLVPAMGQHDPLDGWITCVQLASSGAGGEPGLERAAADFAALSAHVELRTADPLGLGGLLADACRVAQLAPRGAFRDGHLLCGLLAAAAEGLALWTRGGEAAQPAARRLAFRELGLAIGLAGSARLRRAAGSEGAGVLATAEARARLEALAPYEALGADLVSFWLAPAHRAARTWTEHLDIDEVMLATSLLPEGFLVLRPGR